MAHTVKQCINARGAIAHGQKTENIFTAENMSQHTDVTAALDCRGGTKYLTSATEIKKELMENGPVVSTSFVPSKAVVSGAGLLRSRVNKQHELLLIGWTLAAYGEMWLAMPLDRQLEPIRIAFGQFGIDEMVMAPKNSFENVPWQSGPYLDLAFRYSTMPG